jgi:hypothetical protein
MRVIIAGMMARPAAERREVEDWARDSMTKASQQRTGDGESKAKEPVQGPDSPKGL